jgi:hypothetical protein
MAVTTVKRIENYTTTGTVFIRKYDFSKEKYEDWSVDARQNLEMNISIPWAAAQDDFDAHHLELAVGQVWTHALWQADNGDGDYVRLWTNPGLIDPRTPWGKPAWKYRAPYVPGTPANARAGGDRTLVIGADRSITLKEYPPRS